MELLKLIVVLMTFGRFSGAADFDYDIQGNFYVIDRAANMLVKYSPRGDSLVAVSGFGSGSLQFDDPAAVYARRANDIYVADDDNHRVQRFNRTLDYITTIHRRNEPEAKGRFGYPRDIAVTRQGDLLIVDGENARIAKIDPFGEAQRSFGDINAGAGRLLEPSKIEVDDDDNAYVLDRHRLLQFDPFGSYVRDVPLPLNVRPVNISIDRDTLVVLCPDEVYLYDLATDSFVISYALESPGVAARLVGGRMVVLENRRCVVYALPEAPGDSGR